MSFPTLISSKRAVLAFSDGTRLKVGRPYDYIGPGNAEVELVAGTRGIINEDEPGVFVFMFQAEDGTFSGWGVVVHGRTGAGSLPLADLRLA